MHHILGNKVLEYDVDDRGVIVDEREYDRTVNPKPNIADWVKEHMVFWYDMSKPVDVYAENFNDWKNYNPNSVSITNNKIVVNGLIDNCGVTDYIGLTITQLPSGQSVPTNEILKANPYLQDFSGNNRPLKLNNFLFAAMSGVGGYEYNWLDSALFITYLNGTRGNGTITDNTITINNVK